MKVLPSWTIFGVTVIATYTPRNKDTDVKNGPTKMPPVRNELFDERLDIEGEVGAKASAAGSCSILRSKSGSHFDTKVLAGNYSWRRRHPRPPHCLLGLGGKSTGGRCRLTLYFDDVGSIARRRGHNAKSRKQGTRRMMPSTLKYHPYGRMSHRRCITKI